MFSLPLELENTIFSFLDKSTIVALRLTSKQLYSRFPRQGKGSDKFFAELCIEDGNFKLFLLAREWGQPVLESYYHEALSTDNQEVLDYLRPQIEMWDKNDGVIVLENYLVEKKRIFAIQNCYDCFTDKCFRKAIEYNHITLVEDFLKKEWVVTADHCCITVYTNEKILKMLLSAKSFQFTRPLDYRIIVNFEDPELTTLYLKHYLPKRQHDPSWNDCLNLALTAKTAGHLECLLNCKIPEASSVLFRIKFLKTCEIPFYPTMHLLDSVISGFDYEALTYLYENYPSISSLNVEFGHSNIQHAITEQCLDLIFLIYPFLFELEEDIYWLAEKGVIVLKWLDKKQIPYDIPSMVLSVVVEDMLERLEFLSEKGYKFTQEDFDTALEYDLDELKKLYSLLEEDVKEKLTVTDHFSEGFYKNLKWCVQQGLVSREVLEKDIEANQGDVESVLHWMYM